MRVHQPSEYFDFSTNLDFRLYTKLMEKFNPNLDLKLTV